MDTPNTLYHGKPGQVNVLCPKEDCPKEFHIVVPIVYYFEDQPNGTVALHIKQPEINISDIVFHGVMDHGWIQEHLE